MSTTSGDRLDLDPKDVEHVVAVLREQVVALRAECSRTPNVVRVRAGEVSIEAEWHDHQPSVPAPGPVALPAAPTVAAAPARPAPATTPGHQVCAQVVGVFYEAREPGAEPFVAVGDLVTVGQQVGIIEAMKLMTPVEADLSGRVVKILVANGTAVEHGQPLMVVAAAT